MQQHPTDVKATVVSNITNIQGFLKGPYAGKIVIKQAINIYFFALHSGKQMFSSFLHLQIYCNFAFCEMFAFILFLPTSALANMCQTKCQYQQTNIFVGCALTIQMFLFSQSYLFQKLLLNTHLFLNQPTTSNSPVCISLGPLLCSTSFL